MNVPRRRVEQRDVGDEDGVGVHELDEVPARVLELVLVKFRPPYRTLPIYCPVVAWMRVKCWFARSEEAIHSMYSTGWLD